MPGALLGDDVLLGGALGVVLRALGPHLDDVTGPVAEVLGPAAGADDRVAAPVVGGEVALLVGGHDPVAHGHHEHGVVLDVDDGVEVTHLVGGPVLEAEPVLHDGAGARPGRAPLGLPVDHESAHADDAGRRGVSQPAHDVDVVGGLLQQQAGDVAALGVPVAEVVVAAVAHEVAAPDGLELADPPGVDDRLQQPHHLHVAHVVAHVEAGAGAPGHLQDAVGGLDGDGQGLLQVDRDAGLEEEAGQLLVRVVGSGQDDRVDPVTQQVAVVGHDRHALGQEPLGALGGVGSDVGRGDQPGRDR